MTLTEYLHQETQINTETLAFINSLFEQQEYKKYHLLLKEGSHSKQLFYVEKGLLRLFYNKEDKDITHTFLLEQMFLPQFHIRLIHYLSVLLCQLP